MAELYCKAVFERGTGLGNRLFPWARCTLFARRHGATMIDPVWPRLAIGQFFRGGIDYGSYLRQLMLLGQFRRNPANLGPVSGLLRSRGLPVRDEGSDGSGAAARGAALMLFKGFADFFAPLAGHRQLLLDELRAVARPQCLRLVEAVGEVPIGVCVRCGNDYREPSSRTYGPLGPADKTPLEWYVAMLAAVRAAVGRPVRALVVSDGTREALRPLLAIDNVAFVRPGAALSDLLVLSRARVLLVPGASSFAAWACFLGEMPSASHPGQPLSVWQLDTGRGRFLGEVNPDDPPGEFLEQARNALAGVGG